MCRRVPGSFGHAWTYVGDAAGLRHAAYVRAHLAGGDLPRWNSRTMTY